MKDEIIDIVKSEMLNYLNTQQMSRLNKVLEHALLDVPLSIEENKPAPSIYTNEEFHYFYIAFLCKLLHNKINL